MISTVLQEPAFISGVGVFVAIVLALVALILAARSKLVASGDVRILVKGRLTD